MPHVCPPWVGRLLLSPARKLLENPETILGPFVREGMTVLEPGCAMGYYTLPLAKMVGPHGRVIALDVQQVMLDGLKKRAEKAGLSERIDMRLVECKSLNMEDLVGSADFAVALNVVHETPDQKRFFQQIHDVLKPGARLLIHEPGFHVSAGSFAETLAIAVSLGFVLESQKNFLFRRAAVLTRQ